MEKRDEVKAEEEGPREPTKGDLLAFVRGAQGNPRYRKSFVEAEWWSDEAEFKEVYVEQGWTDEDGFLNEKGAAIINYSDDMHTSDDGFDAVLAELNAVGVDEFVRDAAAFHEEIDEERDEDGFTGTGSFTDTDGGFL